MIRAEKTLPLLEQVVNHFTEIGKRCYSPYPLQAAILGDLYGNQSSLPMLQKMTDDALEVDDSRYPLKGAMPERGGVTVSKGWPAWRPTLFCSAPYIRAVVSDLVSALPFGIAVRSGELTEALKKYMYKGYLIDFRAAGAGDAAESLIVNGKEVLGSLQIPEDLLMASERNVVEVKRGTAKNSGSRIYRSEGVLRSVSSDTERRTYEFYFPVAGSIVWQGGAEGWSISGGADIELEPIPGTAELSIAYFEAGNLTLECGVK